MVHSSSKVKVEKKVLLPIIHSSETNSLDLNAQEEKENCIYKISNMTVGVSLFQAVLAIYIVCNFHL